MVQKVSEKKEINEQVAPPTPRQGATIPLAVTRHIVNQHEYNKKNNENMKNIYNAVKVNTENINELTRIVKESRDFLNDVAEFTITLNKENVKLKRDSFINRGLATLGIIVGIAAFMKKNQTN